MPWQPVVHELCRFEQVQLVGPYVNYQRQWLVANLGGTTQLKDITGAHMRTALTNGINNWFASTQEVTGVPSLHVVEWSHFKIPDLLGGGGG